MRKTLLLYHLIFFISFYSSGQTNCPSLPSDLLNGLVAYYPFCGNANDVSGNNNNPNFNSATLTTDRFGNPNSAYSFNGINQYIKGSSNNYPTLSRTISFWFKLNTDATNPVLFAYGGAPCGTSFFSTINQTSFAKRYTVQAHCWVDSCSTNKNYPANNVWTNWTISSGNNVTKFYINGILTETFQNRDFNGTAVFGREFSFGVCTGPNTGIAPYIDGEIGYLNGSLDDIIVYNRVLDDNSVSQLYSDFSTNQNTATTYTTGYTNVETTVGENGEAIASVKLNLPKGTFVQPSISLDYSSQNAGSLAGQGMVLSGVMQAITRTAPTYEQDGFSEGIKFSPVTDRYALNGERLMATFPYTKLVGDYLANAAQGEFKTEQETFQKIIPHVSFSATNGWKADSFTVYTKDGLIMEFGYTPDSRIEAAGTADKVYAWLLNKVSDRNGNYYTIIYTEDNINGEYRPAQILYTGNTQKGILPYNKINFSYETRPDAITKFFDGYSTITTKRLTAISIYDHDTLYRKYTMNYLPVVGTSKLTKITEFGRDSVTALKPVVFNWANSTFVGFNKAGSGNWTGHSLGIANNFIADFNGDGKSDMAGYESNGNWKICLSTGTNFNVSTWTGHTLGNTNNLIGDFNGDGKSDMAGYAGIGSWQVSISMGNYFTTSTWTGSFPGPNYTKKYVGDFNGDGISDIAAYAGGGNWDIYLSTGVGFQTSTWNDGNAAGTGVSTLGDFNADGKTDIASYSSGAIWRVALSTGSGFISSWWNGHAGDGNNSLSGDFNGDGVTDITRYESNGLWNMCMSDGKYSFACQTGWIANSNGTAGNVVGDYNGDGLSDLACFIGNSLWNVSFSTGVGFLKSDYIVGHNGGISNNAVGDFNGDGITDLISYSGVGSWNVALANVDRNFVSSIQTGNGALFSFEYKPITDPNVYTKGGDSKYPNIDFDAPFYVVSKLTNNNGIGGTRSQYFKYANGIINLKGRGFRGFGLVTRIDSVSNAVQATTYNTDYRYVGARPVRIELRTVDGKLLNLTLNTVGFTKTGYNLDSVCFSYFSKVEELSYELDGSLMVDKNTFYTYDIYGSVTQLNEIFNNAYTVVTDNVYTNDAAKWILGRLTSATVSKSKPGKPSIVKNSSFTYSNGFLTQEILLPSDTKLRLQKDYILDSFGNRIQTTISGPGIATRSEKVTYSSDGRFVIQTQNAIGFTNKTSYKNGFPATIIDAEGRVTTVTRDLFGREIRVDYPDGTFKTTSYNDCVGGNCPPNTIWFLQEQASGSVIKKTYFDILDRPIRKESESFSSNNILSDIVYNADGTVNKESDNYFSNSSPSNWTTFTYDEIKRLLSKTEPDSRTTQIQYNGLSKTETNPQNQKVTKIENQQGKLVTTIDNQGNQILFDYDADFNLNSITDPNGNKVSMTYDLRGNKTAVNDPDMGNYTYQYNCLGLLTKQTNPKGESVIYTYDLLNRQSKRTEPEGTTQWVYDPANGKGQVYQIKTNNVIVQKYSYNSFGKLSQVTYTRNAKNKLFSYSYNNANGMLEQINMPNNVSINYVYTTKGYLNNVIGIGLKPVNVTLWSANNYDQNNQLTSFITANGVVTNRVYDPSTFYLTGIKAGIGSAIDSLENLSMHYSSIGNLLERKDVKLNLRETFNYDDLNRLLTAQVDGQNPLTMQYDILGNISFKSDVGSYKYGEAGKGPHTLTSIDHSTVDSCVYAFNQIIAYTSYNYTAKITNANTEIAFLYGPGREREVMTVKKNNILIQTKNYYGGMYEEVTDSAGKVSYNYYIKAGNEVVAMVYSPSNKVRNNSKISYLLFDHLGSVYAYTDEAGKITERVSYNAWGQQRDPFTWQVFKIPKNLPSFQRGFTFHEMLDMDFLVCMNARVYNPVLGRFLTPDPYVQFPDNLQSMNRYAYVLNNPLSFTDPSGYFLNGLKGFLKKNASAVVSIGIMIATGGTGAIFSTVLGSSFLGAVASGAAVGFGASFTSVLVNGGSIDIAFKAGIQGGVIGGITAGITYGVGKAFDTKTLNSMNAYNIPKSIVNGVVQGEFSRLQGGEFNTGFAMGFAKEFLYGNFKDEANSITNQISNIKDKIGSYIGEGLSKLQEYRIFNYPGTITMQGPFQGGITFPPLILIENGFETPVDILDVYRHEYGHFIQFGLMVASTRNLKTSYLMYLGMVGIPSLISANHANQDNTYNHQNFWTEKSANSLSYFFRGSPSDWNHNDYPVYEIFK
ncbi:FG-GAP-like repeat-containing protein [Limnovirga soli]|uniref:Insecticide toxin TcdB middle/N-terminal domain-containing protein n=1 Tax=Limnovirga soli TaxID=2656915 RepID=A0A8J8FBM6_9BACT|nr:FG-GAP-like repeat-containing protein [Limnovirga soli]NNV55035.1 hypothetical protein [Limnovirga soli]